MPIYLPSEPIMDGKPYENLEKSPDANFVDGNP